MNCSLLRSDIPITTLLHVRAVNKLLNNKFMMHRIVQWIVVVELGLTFHPAPPSQWVPCVHCKHTKSRYDTFPMVIVGVSCHSEVFRRSLARIPILVILTMSTQPLQQAQCSGVHPKPSLQFTPCFSISLASYTSPHPAVLWRVVYDMIL